MAPERTEAEEWEFVRNIRCIDLFPNPKRLTGRRKELALAYEALSDEIKQIRAKIDELDSEVFLNTKECDCHSEED
jgi:hypothetical protein